MKKHNSILFSLLIGIIYAHKFMVEINFDDLSQLHQLVEMGIDLDHHRNLTEVNAFVTEDEFQTISNLNFSIHEIPNKAKIYFEELSKKSSYSRNPMEEYHNYNELTEFLQNIADNYPNITKLESYVHPQGFDVAQFYIDFEGHPEQNSVKLAIEEMKFFCKRINILGVYKKLEFRKK